MAAVVGTLVDNTLALMFVVETKHIRSKLVLYKPWIYFNNHLKQMYISNKIKHFIYKDECSGGCTYIEACKRRIGLQINSFGLVTI